MGQVPRVPARERPDYINKADYGQVPAYLAQVKDEIARENEMIDEFVKAQMGIPDDIDDAPAMRELPEYERDEILDQLKSKWDSVNEKYQKMCHTNLYTHGKVTRKENMESE